jgi:hypothetical protein
MLLPWRIRLSALSSFWINLEAMNLIDNWQDSLDEGSACRKATTYKGKHEHKTNADIHATSGFQIHDPSVRAIKDILCLRPRGHCDPTGKYITILN